MRALLRLGTALLAFTACNDAPQTTATKAIPTDTTIQELQGCYLGDTGNTSDTLALVLQAAGSGEIRGDFRIALYEKDQRRGTIYGLRGADGIYRTTFRFMQEGVSDSVQLQFRAASSGATGVELRPSAYDPVTGREYPDSTKPFSIRLNKRECENAAAPERKP